jgi:hypothetical protein
LRLRLFSSRPVRSCRPFTRNVKNYVASVLLTLLTTTAAGAAPTPLPGGANEVSAQSGVLGRAVWNGAVRMTLVYLRDATPEEAATNPPLAGKKDMAYEVKFRNGLHDDFVDLVEYTLADKDDVTVAVPPIAELKILQGAAAVQKGVVAVDTDFVPVKLIAQCVTCPAHSPFKTVRFTIPASSQSN